ncbi:hypothetical protein D0862_08332 [Hortaea werneckii]|uniref:Uncharacterized protein n=2 Tax=Hortaea werneckii TaxID=91943 RepID=A0A3M7G7E6_HORWE|nr:hypothetical protein D0862_08332 [Hortaea werneckii]
MPHKHTRRKTDSDEAHFNLAPSTIAKSLPAYEKKGKTKGQPKKDDVQRQQKLKRKRTEKSNYKYDDTPRAFARAMQWQESGKRPSGLDDGNSERRNKKKAKVQQQKEEDTSAAAANAATDKEELPKILPGEKLSDYAARVDQALPVSGLARKGKMNLPGMKERQTKTEKRLHKLYAQWREEEAKIREKEDERQEQEEEEEDEKQAAYGDVKFPEST